MKYPVSATPTALGEFLVIIPPISGRQWLLVSLNNKLQMISTSSYDIKQETLDARFVGRRWQKYLAQSRAVGSHTARGKQIYKRGIQWLDKHREKTHENNP